MQLGGQWRAAPAEEELRRAFVESDFDDGAWESLTVPGHWRSHPAFDTLDGPLLYRRRFERSDDPSTRTWLTFEGLFYQGDVWLDGAYLGDTEGYFLPHTFEITEQVQQRSEHVLALELTCAPQLDRTAKRNLTGVFQHWDCLDPQWNPGGIWRPVRVESTGPVRIRDLRVLCREASPQRAVVVLRANLLCDTPRAVRVRSTLGGLDHELTRTLAAGENHVEWTMTVDQPALWWPWALGEQALHEVTVEVWVEPASTSTDGGGNPAAFEPSHRRTVRTGLRQIELRNWICSVNGERLFLKGSNHGPTRMAIAEATAEELQRDVHLARDAGLDLLRIHAHITRPELYDAADESGMLLWQDMPLQWGYATGVRKQAVRQARAAVQVLGHHPSIAIWCGHNEPMAIDVEPGGVLGVGVAGTALVAQLLPTWNKTILDRSIKKALENADGSRPVIAHSGVLPHPPQLDGTDSHFYFGWYHGEERDFPRLARALPRLVRFVTEFGAQAVPPAADFCAPERWPDLDWEFLGHRHALQKPVFDRYVPPERFATFDEWRDATQDYQATVIRHHIETLRRLKYRPTGGFAHFCFADAMPAVTWSVLDHERNPKAGYQALIEACRPVIVVSDRLPETVAGGESIAVDVHVVSDLRIRLEGFTVTAVLRWDGGSLTWRWAGDLDADCCTKVGTIRTEVPDVPGPLTIDLALEGPVVATNRDQCRIVQR